MIDPRSIWTKFQARYGQPCRLFQAPGRVNLIGEHTDYNEGFVLPMALGLGTTVAAAPRKDRRVYAYSENLHESIEFDLDRPGPPRRGAWIDYVEGVAQALLQSGKRIEGADLLIESDLPAGAGLSSSAALEISVGLALLSLAGETIDRVALARAGQAAEHHYVGAMCGLMDQLTAALAEEGAALFIDCRTNAATPVPMAASEVTFLISDTRKKHALASSEYNTRRAECERAVELLREALPSILSLRDVTTADLAAHEGRLPEPIRRRARHVVTENARTEAASRALSARDFKKLGELMRGSHLSLRDDYEVSSPELDLLVDTALIAPGVLGARMTGGGFGGSTVTLLETHRLDDVKDALRRALRGMTGEEPLFIEARPGRGAIEIEVKEP